MKLAAIDLDGTLLRSDCSISELPDNEGILQFTYDNIAHLKATGIENLHSLIDDLDIVLRDIVSEQNATVEKQIDPEAEKKLMAAVSSLKDAVDTCSSTQCKRILDEIENIAFDSSREALLRKFKELIEDYCFTEAAEILEKIEKTFSA